MAHDSETYRFNLDKLDLIHDAVGEETDDDRLEQIDKRVRVGTVTNAMDDRDFLAAEVQRLRRIVARVEQLCSNADQAGAMWVRLISVRAALADQPARRTRIEGMSLG